MLALISAGLTVSLPSLAAAPATAARSEARSPAVTHWHGRANRNVAAAGETLPDSILAMVGRRKVTVADFRRAWRETHLSVASERPTPESARQFLEVLIDRELIQAAAARRSWPLLPEDSARSAARADRLTLTLALGEALAGSHAPGDSAEDELALGVKARDRVVAELRPGYDAALVDRAAQAFAALPQPTPDSALAVQLRLLSAAPRFAPEDTGRVLAHTDSDGDYRVRDLLRQWSALPPTARPRVESAEQVRQLIANGLFERWLRRRAHELDLAHAAPVLEAVRHERELIAVQHLMTQEIHSAIVIDTAAVRRWFVAHAGDWTLPERYRVIRLVLSDRDAATRMALELRDLERADSLVARAARNGVRYQFEIDAQQDSASFARAHAAGPGMVVGPDQDGDGWSVLRVEALLPARTRTWNEARAEAIDRWYEEQSAARLRALLDRERRATRVRVRELPFEPATLSGLTEP